MKTIKKFKINSNKLLKDEELVNLKGGYACSVECLSEGGGTNYGYLMCDVWDCDEACQEAFQDTTAWARPQHCD